MSLPDELAFVFGDVSTVFHRTHVISREMVAENTLALTIERPEGFAFSAGQHTLVSIPGPVAEHLTELSIASAPHEQSIVIATRIRASKFKDTLYALTEGDAITLRSASGSLWSTSAAPQVWLSGGIGISPFRSIIRNLTHQRAAISVTHLHSDRSRASVPFMQEFESYANDYDGYRFIPTFTREKGRGGESGRITRALIASHVPNAAESNYFVVGTESFVAAMRSEIATLGVSAVYIHTERFEGYRNHSA